MGKCKLNKSFVDGIPASAEGKTVFYFDDDLKGFGLRVSGKTKSYIVQAYVHSDGRSTKVRVKLGKHGELTAEEARAKAKKVLGEMASGTDPNARKKRKESLEVTLADLFEEYKEARAADGGLRPKTLSVYGSALKRCFPDWLDMPAAKISKDMVIERFRQIATTQGPRSKEGGARAQAAQGMRVLRTLLNYGAISYEDKDGRSLLPDNPVSRLKQAHRGWSRVAPKHDVIATKELKDWYQGVLKLPHQTQQDFLLFCLFTGLRRGAASQLKWTDCNMRGETIVIPESTDKTGKGQRLPMSDYVKAMLKRRHSERNLANLYVFPGEKPGDHLQDPKTAIAKVVSKSGVKFSTHTLRRTFATTAERLDISYYKVKQLLNHAVSGDVTGQHYVQVDVEQLREPMQQIADYFKQQMEIDQPLIEAKRSVASST